MRRKRKGWLQSARELLSRRPPDRVPQPTPTTGPGGPPMAEPGWEPEPTPDPEPVPAPAPKPLPVAMPDEASKATIMSVLSVFETGKAEGDYSACAVLEDGAGISYGLHQATDGGGSLHAIMSHYVQSGGLYWSRIEADLEWIAAHGSTHEDPKALSPRCVSLMDVLQAAADEDPYMRASQDAVFESRYWAPSVGDSESMGLTTPLGWLVVYDSWVHSGGTGKIRPMFPELPPSKGGAEALWVSAYVLARWDWLANHPNARVRQSKGRIEAIQQLIDADNWELVTPFKVLGVAVGSDLV